MKQYTKKELQEQAEKIYFPKHTSVGSMIATSDGNFFYPHRAGEAKYHAQSNKLEIHVLERKPGRGSQKSASNFSRDKEYATGYRTIAKAINAVKNVSELDAVVEKYNLQNDNRKTVKDAYQKARKKFANTKSESGTTTTGTGGASPTKDEAIKLIKEAKTEQALNALDAEYDFSKSDDEAIKAAFEEQENTYS